MPALKYAAQIMPYTRRRTRRRTPITTTTTTTTTQTTTTTSRTTSVMPDISTIFQPSKQTTKTERKHNSQDFTSTWTIAIALLILLINHGIYVCVAKKLNASQAFDNTWSTATDLENELECVSAQQQKRSAKNTPYNGGSSSSSSGGGGGSSSSSNNNHGPWSAWSDWSTCSRSCDGGVMQQIRRCQNANSCKGDTVRYRICNMQPCPEQQDFRARQCAAYNDVPYDGSLYKWASHYDYVEPCALTCRGRPSHLSDDVSLESTAEDGGDHYDELSVVVQLNPRVQDGTRCRSGSLDMCIQGKCMRVGCDLKIGSTKKVDNCGICGGDGSSCSQTLYHWEVTSMSLCSVSCGGGYKMSNVMCRNRVTGVEVEDALCNVGTRPEPTVELCNTHTCPPRWIADEWGPCSRLCGYGVRERMIVCAEENNGIKTRVPDMLCPLPKPPLQEQCILEECPKWDVEEWSECSVPCGQGIQVRGVECKSSDGRLSAKCDPLTKPSSVQQCGKNNFCESIATINGGSRDGSSVGVNGNSGSSSNSNAGTFIVGSSNRRADKSNDRNQSDMDEPNDDGNTADDDNDDADDDEDSADVEDDLDTSTYNDQPYSYAHQTVNRLQHDETEGPKTMRLTGNGGYNSRHNRPSQYENENEPSEPTFIKDNDWSPCSVTCGEGIRRRPYRCKIFLEYSRTLAIVNDSLCEGIRPHDEVERCVEEPCMLPSHGYEEQYPRDAIKVGVSEPGKTYVWREQGYTSCSASCLGGVEELIINCVREDNGRVVSPFLCAPETKPESRVRTCNDRPCPPRWNYSDYTPCSKSCGIGIKTREVQCIHEVTRGGDNTMVVPNSMCPQPPPADRQYCNVLDCPVRWEVGEWSKCSHTCGYGIKERKVECKQIMAQEHKIERPETMCPSARPSDKKPCNVKTCPPEDPKPVIQISNTTHIQHDPKKSKITLKVGGAGVVFFGTQVKIKCPVKRYNRTKIKWTKDHKPLVKSRKFKVSKKGALRILDITFRDAGVYSCHAGLSTADIQIDVKAKPGQQSDNFDSRHESDRLVRERSGLEALTAADMTSLDNRTQTTRRKQQQQQQLNSQLNGRERNGRLKMDGTQRTDSSRIEDEQSQLMQQAQDGLSQSGTVSSGSNARHTNALLAMPYFQTLLANLQYLWPSLQKFSNSHGHRMLLNREGNWHRKYDDIMDFHQEDDPQQILPPSASASLSKSLSSSSTSLAKSSVLSKTLLSSLESSVSVADENENEMNSLKVMVGEKQSEQQHKPKQEQGEGEDNEKEEEMTTAIPLTAAAAAAASLRLQSLHVPHVRWPNHWTNTHLFDTNYNRNGMITATVQAITTTTTTPASATSSITYKWQTSPWSECSQKCNAIGIGLRRRTVTCIRVHFINGKTPPSTFPPSTFPPSTFPPSPFSPLPSPHPMAAINYTIETTIVRTPIRTLLTATTTPMPMMPLTSTTSTTAPAITIDQEVVESIFCESSGLIKPNTYEACTTNNMYIDNMSECAHWIKGEWSLCQRSHCYGPNTAIQKRKISCRFINNTLANICPEYKKPISRQECYNERCKGVWRTEPWSECNAPCGQQGIKYRILQCVWYGTRQPAGNACRHQQRPPVMKVCKSSPCFIKERQQQQRQLQQRCKDTSRYCRNVRRMGLCRLYRYQEKCCKSCRHSYNYHNISN